MKSIHTEILIDAPIDICWDVLVGFGKYPEWNPFIRSLHGDLALGSEVDITVELTPPTVRHGRGKIVELDIGSFLMVRSSNKMFTGNHYFKLETVSPSQVKFIHGENFSGLLPFFAWKKMNLVFETAFCNMNEAFKTRVETHNIQ